MNQFRLPATKHLQFRSKKQHRLRQLGLRRSLLQLQRYHRTGPPPNAALIATRGLGAEQRRDRVALPKPAWQRPCISARCTPSHTLAP